MSKSFKNRLSNKFWLAESLLDILMSFDETAYEVMCSVCIKVVFHSIKQFLQIGDLPKQLQFTSYSVLLGIAMQCYWG